MAPLATLMNITALANAFPTTWLAFAWWHLSLFHYLRSHFRSDILNDETRFIRRQADFVAVTGAVIAQLRKDDSMMFRIHLSARGPHNLLQIVDVLRQWFPNLFEPLPKSR